MRFLVFLVFAFVNTFGITQPTPAGAERAARYLGVVLGIALILAAVLAMVLRARLRT